MSAFLPFVNTVTIESAVWFAKKAASKVAIFGNLSFIVLGGMPRTPWHFRQLSSYGVLPCAAWSAAGGDTASTRAMVGSVLTAAFAAAACLKESARALLSASALACAR